MAKKIEYMENGRIKAAYAPLCWYKKVVAGLKAKGCTILYIG